MRALPASALIGLAALCAPTLGHAQSPPPDAVVDGVVVVARDQAGLLEKRPTATVLGYDKSLLETPRSASFASAETLERYGVRTIDDLVAVTPGGFTDSYYGVPGALALRGTLAETYYDGFKRIEDRGTYPTPIGSAERVEIVRGPPSPLYGPGKVGGFLNIAPKTARADGGGFPAGPYGEVEAQGGAYGFAKLDGSFAAPISLGALPGGLRLYAEAERGAEYYRGIRPDHYLVQARGDLDLPGGWRLAVSGQGERVEGAVQTPGWNRLTQALIDHGTYLTGRDTTLKDLNGDGRLTPNEIGAGGLITGYFGFPPGTDPRFTLDQGVGTATLSRRTVFTSDADFSNTDTATLLATASRRDVSGGVLKLSVFYDDLYNRRFVSYGFPAAYDAGTWELRASYAVDRTLGAVRLQGVAGASVRRYDGRQRESFNGGNIAIDRRDLIAGPSATDIIGGIDLPFETDIRSRFTDGGLFAQADANWGRWDLSLGGRCDRYDLTSRDDGTVVFGAAPGKSYSTGDGDWSFTTSLAYQLPFGLRPYATWAETAALEVGQAGGVSPQLIASGGWLSRSRLLEAGVKLRLFSDAVTGALAAYRQTRTQLGEFNTVSATRGEGVEAELRWLASRTLSFTAALAVQRTRVAGPDGSFFVIPPSTAGVAPQAAYGGSYAVYALSQLVPGNYTDTLVPRTTAAVYAVYTSERHAWGRAGVTGGVRYVSETSGVIPGAVRLPDYATVSLSGFVERGPWRVSLNVDNLTDTLFFTPVADVYANVAALPGEGRTWRLGLKRVF
jgi:iron complex outermembrane receptor protein